MQYLIYLLLLFAVVAALSVYLDNRKSKRHDVTRLPLNKR
jgi:hypothetical protein